MKNKTVIKILLCFFIVYIGIAGLVYFNQSNMLFFPTSNPNFDLSIYKNVRDISFDEKGVHYQGYIYNEEKIINGVIFYYGGNAEEVTYSIVDYLFIYDRAVVFFNYRGYGKSTGNPSQETLFRDAEIVYQRVVNKYSPLKITFMGRSLGTGVACYMGSKYEVTNLILITPYDSILNLARENFSFLPLNFMLKNPFRSDIYVKNIDVPILVIIAMRDRVIPNKRSLALLGYMKNSPTVIDLEKAGHNNVAFQKEFKSSILDFLAYSL